MQTAWFYSAAGGRLDSDTARRLAQIADLVCEIWRRPDCGIWEVRSEPLHFTHSKMMCWVALDRAVRLAERGEIPHAHAARWRAQAEAICAFIDERCFSDELGSYVRSAGSVELDASLLLGALMEYPARRDPRMNATIAAIRRELGNGPLLDRYSGADGLAGGEGAFLCCSFWLVDALARAERADEATALMDQLIGLANDVGLYAEEVDQHTGEFLGNIPQGLVHLALPGAEGAPKRTGPGFARLACMDSGTYNLALVLHLLGALAFVGGIVLAGAAFEAARRRTRPAEIALLLSMTRIGVLLVAVGTLLIAAFGLWLVHLGHWGYGSGWVDASIGLYVAALVLGGLEGQRPKQARHLAAQLAEQDAPVNDELRALLDDPVSRAENYGSLALIIGIVVIMVFKP
jgi:uncharacterized membrane protein